MTLKIAKKGTETTIKRVNAEGVILQKLYDMGFVPGVKLQVLRSAPFNDPLQIKIHDYLIGVRISEAECIEVEQ